MVCTIANYTSKAMGQLLHGKATTTHAIRTKIQASKASGAALSKHYGVNPKTILKWKGRGSVEVQTCGSKPGQNSVPSNLDEALVVETRSKTLLPLDDLLDLLLPFIPALTRSNLHRSAAERHQPSPGLAAG
jgi:hypothetical protein